VTISFLHRNLFTEQGNHFTASGYNQIGQIMHDWLRSVPLESVIKYAGYIEYPQCPGSNSKFCFGK